MEVSPFSIKLDLTTSLEFCLLLHCSPSFYFVADIEYPSSVQLLTKWGHILSLQSVCEENLAKGLCRFILKRLIGYSLMTSVCDGRLWLHPEATILLLTGFVAKRRKGSCRATHGEQNVF